ncbi:MAG TPA: hypothetical protein VFP50_05000 [Anaeromyxobacteraceae bacterium]|nr:hypothetical protein [Anaeromyxobacteraceae bacterium]
MIGTITGLALALALSAGDEVQRAEHDPRDDGPGQVDVTAYPPEMKAHYPVFLQKCSKCHPAARAINSRFDPGEWKRYMKKMIRRPNSGINEEQAAGIYDFLKFYSAKQAGK